jgi:hypothetical protein
MCDEYTKFIIEEYAKLDFVDKIILSTYQNDIQLPPYVDVVLNEVIDPPGVGNRNLQINTSRNGLKNVNSEFVVKMRTDQYIRLPSMEMMYDFASKHVKNNLMCVLGMYTRFPYHPRDHVFWGRTEDLINLFDIPYDPDPIPNPQQDYRFKTRAETYIGQFYYARFDPSIIEHIQNPLKYTVDTAPNLHEALEKDFAIRDKLFLPFPKISLAWPKHGLNEYHYHVGKFLSEYWSE